MCEACEAAHSRLEAASNLRLTLQARLIGRALKEALPIEEAYPPDIAALLKRF